MYISFASPDRFCFVFVCFFDNWVLGNAKFGAKKNTHTEKNAFVNGLAGAHGTRVQTIRTYLQKLRRKTSKQKKTFVKLLAGTRRTRVQTIKIKTRRG